MVVTTTNTCTNRTWEQPTFAHCWKAVLHRQSGEDKQSWKNVILKLTKTSEYSMCEAGYSRKGWKHTAISVFRNAESAVALVVGSLDNNRHQRKSYTSAYRRKSDWWGLQRPTNKQLQLYENTGVGLQKQISNANGWMAVNAKSVGN